MKKQEEHKEITRKRSSYHDVDSYDDELAIVRELLEGCDEYERALVEEFEIQARKLEELYDIARPFFYNNGMLNNKELNLLIRALDSRNDYHTELSEAIQEIKDNIRDIEERMLWTWLCISYEITKQKTAKSIKLDSQSPVMRQMNTTQKRDEIILKPWCPDKLTVTDRIHKNTRTFEQKLDLVLTQGIRRGWSKEKMTNVLRNITGIELYKARRLIRTETMAIWSKTTKELFLAKGIEYVEIIGDAECGGICLDYVGGEIPLKDAELGGDLPRYHPNCACSFCAYEVPDDEE